MSFKTIKRTNAVDDVNISKNFLYKLKTDDVTAAMPTVYRPATRLHGRGTAQEAQDRSDHCARPEIAPHSPLVPPFLK
eukprot:354546-Chlamydomonas_euryale.AAC.3